MRDHTHGSNRDWKLMHRYCLHNFTCEDGSRGFLGVVSQPGIMSFLELGYIYDQKGRKHAIQVGSKKNSPEFCIKLLRNASFLFGTLVKMAKIQMTMDSSSRLVMFGMTSKLMFSTELRSCLVMSGKPESLRDFANTNSMELMLGECLNGNTDIQVASQHLENRIQLLYYLHF